ncbi:ABC transporter ATP-binding protein [Candidatus Bathyarchaeota archaeon]|nr:ABC transporter ATP-binding protein [Candidatus Bathyarchaeota archaeon]
MIETPLVEARNLSKFFIVKSRLFEKKVIRAVDEVSFAIRERENVALVGESGCGKSTLGRLLLGLLAPTSGSVLYKNKDVWKMSRSEFKEFRRKAQIIHQDPYSSINPVRTIFQSLAPAMIQHKIVRDKKEAFERAAELLSLVGLTPPEDFLSRYSSRMSGGQMQRIILARALSVNPEFIVADEAVSMLDACLRIGALDLMLDLQKRFKHSYLFITHDFATARYFVKKGGGKIIVMYLGKIIEIGEGDSIIQRPIHPYTQALIAAIPVPDPKIAREKELPRLKSLDVPKLTEVILGCKFNTRCPYAEKICEEKSPELREVKDRLVACHFAENFV